ncbi:AAA family ATPase [Pseudactinotalea suaedae]|uniref:AAA family ATPase n=1 Tax=Pseudactinotalea suaedae TaxID=1524924 RepID=UPI0012E0EB75|nr:MoxR family ATPase [Pseudactinotalea suaedae]
MTQGTPTSTGSATLAQLLQESLSRALRGRKDVVRTTAAVFLARGHLLLEDVPGVGKTTLARALAASVEGTVGRVQFTPDLLPSDLTGVTIYRQESGSFQFHPGPLFATIVIADEINRASPKTQSALLECMQEHQVTVDGTSHPLPEPFMVIATQNPIEMEGTYPLPEAQRDRFMAQVSIGYPPADSELELLAAGGWAPAQTTPVLSQAEALELMAHVDLVFVSDAVRRYVLGLVRATREHDAVELGASPRAGLQLVALARSTAVLSGRDFVLPDDVQEVLVPVLAHRLALTRSARSGGTAPAEVLAEILRSTPVPR